MPKTMRTIEIWTEELPPNWCWEPDNYLGGTPEFVVNTAECLAKLGYEVRVLYDGKPFEQKDVSYLPRDFYQAEDILLACNSIPGELAAFNIYWTNWAHQTQEEMMDFDVRVVLSKFQQESFGKDSVVIGHACWPKQFEDGWFSKKPFCLYSSSPDRGGEFLKEIWPDVKEATGYELICTYDKNISEFRMTQLYCDAKFWLHPCQGTELFCIAAQKAIAAGCIPFYVPDQALGETVQVGIQTTLRNFKEGLIYAIKNPPRMEKVKQKDWMDVTKELAGIIK